MANVYTLCPEVEKSDFSCSLKPEAQIWKVDISFGFSKKSCCNIFICSDFFVVFHAAFMGENKIHTENSFLVVFLSNTLF